MNAEALQATDEYTAVRALLEYTDQPVSVQHLATILKRRVSTIRNVLTPMVMKNEVKEVGDDYYVLTI